MREPIVISARRQVLRLGVLMAAVNVLLPVGLWVWARAHGEAWWEMFDGEQNAVHWFSSVQLLVVGAVAWCNHRVGGLVEPARRGVQAWIWLVFALGFVGLAIDERFEGHEWLRDRVLAPRGIATDVRWLEPGDVGLYLILAAGLVAGALLASQLRRRPPALALFGGAVALAGIVTVLDGLPAAISGEWRLGWFWNYVFEETGQLWAQMLFLASFLVMLDATLHRLGGTDGRGGDALLLRAARRDLPRFVVSLVSIDLALPVGYLVWSGLTGESFYEMFWGEWDPISWFSSVQLLIVALSAYAVYATTVLHRPTPARRSRPWIWLVFAAGFFFLALDERFEWHEALRDDVAEPSGWFVVPGLRAGDVGLFVYLAIGLVCTWWLWRELRENTRARRLFVTALVMSAVIVLEDALDASVQEHLPLPGFWDSAFEEVGELWAQLCFCLSFLAVFHERLPRSEVGNGTG